MKTTKSLLATIDEIFILRVAFLFSAQFALYEGFQDWNRGQPLDLHPEVAVLTLVIYGVSLTLLTMSLLPSDLVVRFRDLPLLLLMLVTSTSAYVVSAVAYRGAYRTDVLAYSHYAAFLFANQGLNPYTQNMVKALEWFSVQPSDLTPLASGSYLATTTFQYPALHFLVFVPFVWLGLRDMRWVLVLFEIGVALTLYIKSPRKLRPMLLLPLFAGSDLMINFTAASVADALWVLPLLFAAFHLDKPVKSGFFYGLACSMKQTPWILAPFLLIYIVRAQDGSEIRARISKTIKFAGMTVLIFLAVNLTFMVADLATWFRNILTPMAGDLVIQSQGLSNLTQVGLLPVGKIFYTVLAIGVAVVLIVNFYVYFDKLRYVFWIFPGIVLWFSYRALTNYVIYWMPLMLVSLILWYRAEKAGSAQVD